MLSAHAHLEMETSLSNDCNRDTGTVSQHSQRCTESDCSHLRNIRFSLLSGPEGLRDEVCAVSTSLCEPLATARPDLSCST